MELAYNWLDGYDEVEEADEEEDESVEQTGEVAGDELAKLWPDDKPSLLCDGDNGKWLVRLKMAR